MSWVDELRQRNVIRVGLAYLALSWLAIQVAETVLPLFGFSDRAPRIIVITLVIGFVPALILAWFFELTPEGLRRDSGSGQHEVTSRTRNRLDRVIVVALLAALGYFAVDKFLFEPARDVRLAEDVAQRTRAEALAGSFGEASIAVLPFVNGSSDPDQQYFSDGIAEELLNLLAQIPGLRVAARTSAFSFRGKDVTVGEIGQALNVANVLEGFLRQAGDRVRVTARLVHAISDTEIWSGSYERRLDDIFAVQDEIAAEVVRGLSITLLEEEPKTRPTSPEVYRLFLQARHLFGAGRNVGAEVEDLLQRAVALDPEYAPAWLFLARHYHRVQEIPLARDAIGHALSIDPNSAYGHGWLGWMAIFYDRDLETGAREYELSWELDPTDLDNLNGVTQVARIYRLFDEAIATGEYQVARDPVCVLCFNNLGETYLVAGRLEQAEDAFRTAITLDPNAREWPEWFLGKIALLRGDPQAALQWFQGTAPSPERTFGLALANYSLGRQADYEGAMREVARLDNPAFLAQAYAWTGNVDGAFEILLPMVAELEPPYDFFLFTIDPLFENLHGDPRWDGMLRNLGLAPDQLEAISFTLDMPDVITATAPSGLEPR